MSRVVRVALAQDNLPVGDLSGNVQRARRRLTQAQEHGADLIVFPELSVTAYPPEDLLLKKDFIDNAADAIDELASAASNITALVGYPMISSDTQSFWISTLCLPNLLMECMGRREISLLVTRTGGRQKEMLCAM